ncbi:glycosyltransferase family 2 protein [Nitrospira sp. BLG_1]|uniref:glycosyltransferase family 2 protein n=1 Tax=Nitrospira sp. BLG_1 TaxID=3395883 RepID=UPI0039BD283A
MTEAHNNTDLSIIIVNWNSKKYLQKCLKSLSRCTSKFTYDIIVLDGASFDGCGEMLRQYFPHVRFVQSHNNMGFGRANNEAFKIARGRSILFLNPDTEIEGSAIETLAVCLGSLPDAGIVGAKLLNSDRSVQTSCIQAFPTILNQFVDSDALRNAFPKAMLWGTGPLYDESQLPQSVDAVSGACLMIKRAVFETVGKFSSDYFMYSEDIDLCFKTRQAGWRTYYIPTAVVVHHGGASSAQSGISVFSSVMMLESRWRFFKRTRPAWYCWLYRAAMLFLSIVRLGVISLGWPMYRVRGNELHFGNRMKKWTARLRWALGGECWVKNY